MMMCYNDNQSWEQRSINMKSIDSGIGKIPGIGAVWAVICEALIDDSDALAAGRRRYLCAAWAEGIILSVVTGIYFTGLLLAAGADDMFIGHVQNATTFCGIMQFFAPLLLERMKRRKAYLLTMRTLYHVINIGVIGILPLLPIGKTAMLGGFITAVILANLISAFSTMGLNVWKIQSVPEQKHNAFFSVLNIGSSIITKAAAFAAGSLLDAFEGNGTAALGLSPTMTAMLLLRCAAVVFAVIELIALARLREFPYEQDADARNNRGLRLLSKPLRDKRFMLAISVILLYYFITALPGNFFDVYLISEVGISYAYISVCSMIVLPISLIMSAVWSVLLEKFGWRPILAIAVILDSLAYFFNLPVTPDTQYFYLWIQICVGVFGPCITIVFAYLPYQNMPKENRTAYLGFQSLMTTVCTFLGNFAGTQFIRLTKGTTLTIFGFTMRNIQYIMIIPFVSLILVGIWVYIVGGLLSKHGKTTENV